jgi:hypothetical protein
MIQLLRGITWMELELARLKEEQARQNALWFWRI